MNKKLVYILIAILTFLILLLSTFMVVGIINRGFSSKDFNTLIKEKTYDLTEIKNLKLNLISDVKILVSDTNELKVVQYGNKKTDEFDDKVDSNSIEILDETHFNFTFFNFRYGSRFEIYLPAEYANSIEIKTISGEIDFNDFNLNLKDLSVKSTSGDITFDSTLNCEDMEFKTISGDVSVYELTGNKITIKTTSGDINTSMLDAKEVAVNSISGEMNLGKIKGITTVKTTSGDIDIDELLILNDSEISTISGDVNIKMNKDNDCIIDKHTISGDSDISSNKYGNHEYDLKIKTTSGDIRVD